MPSKIISIANHPELGLVGLDCDGITMWAFKPEMEPFKDAADIEREKPTGKYSWVKLEQTK